MLTSNAAESLPQCRKGPDIRPLHLLEVARQWDSLVRAGLHHLGQTEWPNKRILRLIPMRVYRLRRQVTPETWVWWVEHDIPPYDRYRCSAYRVQLALDDRDNPILTVQSQAATRAVQPLTVENLTATIAQAGEEPPLVITRHMGPAIDP